LKQSINQPINQINQSINWLKQSINQPINQINQSIEGELYQTTEAS
jgi:hypothetical protein